MNKIIFFLFSVLLFTFTKTEAQFQHKLELQIGAVGNIQYLALPKIKPLTDLGVTYQRYVFPKTYVILGLQGNTRNYSEANTDSADMFTGTLGYNQWMGSIGVRYMFKEEIIETFNFFAEAGFHYTKLNTNGVYQGGRFGKDFFSYKKYRGVGFGFKFGASYQFLSPWYIGTNLAIYTSGGKLGKIEDFTIEPETMPEIEKLNMNESMTRFQFEIRIGKMF